MSNDSLSLERTVSLDCFVVRYELISLAHISLRGWLLIGIAGIIELRSWIIPPIKLERKLISEMLWLTHFSLFEDHSLLYIFIILHLLHLQLFVECQI